MGEVCKMVGMREVARKANVSPGAVSRFLNQDKTLSISEDTKQRIRAAVRDLNYDINKRKYEKAKIQSIGLISTIDRKKEIDDPYFSQLREGIKEEAQRLHLGLNRTYYLAEDNPQEWKDFDHLGAIVIIGTVNESSIQKLMKQNKNIVIVDNPDITADVDLVYADFERMIQKNLSLLVAAGHTNIAYIGGYNIDINEYGKKEINENEKRLRAYKQFMYDQGLKQNINYKLGQWEPLEGRRMADELLAEKVDDFPTAIIVGSDPLAVGVYHSLQSAGKKIGEDLALISFDNIEIAQSLTPGLTSVNINSKEIGNAAVRLASEKINGERGENVVLTFPSKLIERESFHFS